MTVHNFYKEEMQPDDVYIGRAGKGMDGYFGNPFILLRGDERGSTLDKFETYARSRMEKDPEYKRRVAGLYGKRLFCFCAPLSCHGDVLERLANEMNSEYDYGDPEKLVYCPECQEETKLSITDKIMVWRCRCGWSEIEDIIDPDVFTIKVGYGSHNDRVHMITPPDLVGATLVFVAAYGKDPEHCTVLSVEEDKIVTNINTFNTEKIVQGLRDRRIIIPMPWGNEGQVIPF